VNKVEMQFSYDDGTAYQFMNMETFETETVDKTVVSNGNFLMEGMVVQVRVKDEARCVRVREGGA
jgi:translation elongation factor P/translation initiation factor 5A